MALIKYTSSSILKGSFQQKNCQDKHILNLAMENCKVCVTGGAGYIGSFLVKKLLDKGYTVHATLRNLDDESKVGFLRSFSGAEQRLKLFEADLYNPDDFDQAIEGCEFVLHVASPVDKDMVEGTVGGVKNIAKSCIRSGTVKRLICTASVIAASPMKDDGSGYKESMDETCWTPLEVPSPFSNTYNKDYRISKTRAEKELLSMENDGLEVVSLACGIVGGTTYLSSVPVSVIILVSQISNNAHAYLVLRNTEDFMGKVPIVHIEDVTDAHIFCMEEPLIKGRFLCASSYVSSAEMAKCYQKNYPEFHLKQEYLEGPVREIEWGSRKLTERGFKYKFDTKMILDDCINCAKKMGVL